MMRTLSAGVLRRLGLLPGREPPPDMEAAFLGIYDKCKPFTMASIERAYALYTATQYVVARGIPGAVVECGVWRGGSAMISAHTLLALGDTTRSLYLYDTFAGMTKPADVDGEQAIREWHTHNDDGTRTDWCYAPLDEVRTNLVSTGYPEARLHFVKGRVEDTLPGVAPDQIAILRLDTDWFGSTYHELVHLYPRLAPNGVLLIDDYGYWTGQQQAVDQYFREAGIAVMLNRIDWAGRLAIKA